MYRSSGNITIMRAHHTNFSRPILRTRNGVIVVCSCYWWNVISKHTARQINLVILKSGIFYGKRKKEKGLLYNSNLLLHLPSPTFKSYFRFIGYVLRILGHFARGFRTSMSKNSRSLQHDINFLWVSIIIIESKADQFFSLRRFTSRRIWKRKPRWGDYVIPIARLLQHCSSPERPAIMKLEFSLTEARPTTHRERVAVEISLLLQKVEQPLEPCGRR